MNSSVKEIMTATVKVVNEEDHLSKVVDLLKKHQLRHLPVVKGGKIVGIISASDINRLTFGAILDHQDSSEEAVLDMLSVPQVMVSKPRTVQEDDAITAVAEIFVKEKVHSLPVLSGEELVGIVTTTDVIRHFLEIQA